MCSHWWPLHLHHWWWWTTCDWSWEFNLESRSWSSALNAIILVSFWRLWSWSWSVELDLGLWSAVAFNIYMRSGRVHAGYKPCSPQLVSDRITHVTAAYDELLRLANERQSRLKEARKMWQFYDDVEDEEAWIKEKEQIMSSPDLGHDLTSIRLLLTKHKVLDWYRLLSVIC